MNFHENRMFSNAPLNSKRGGGKGPTSPWFYRRKPLISQTINCFHIFDAFEWHSLITKQIIATMPISVNCSENKVHIHSCFYCCYTIIQIINSVNL